MHRRRATSAILLTGLLAIAGCALAQDGPEELTIIGALYVDFHTDNPCLGRDAPPELSGVRLVFRDPDGTVLGDGTTGQIAFELLEFSEGKRGWTHPGCRFYSSYVATVAPADSYSVRFESAPVEMIGAGGWFTGVSDLTEQWITHAELAAQHFAWDFEVSPSYVVGH